MLCNVTKPLPAGINYTLFAEPEMTFSEGNARKDNAYVPHFPRIVVSTFIRWDCGPWGHY